MLIGIDGNEANTETRVGVNQYSFEILWAIYNLQNKWKKRHKFIIYLKSYPKNDLPKQELYWKYKIIKGNHLWIMTRLNWELIFGEKPDIFFTPSHYLPLLTSIPRICTIHDLGYLNFSEHFKKYDFWQLKYWTAISIFISKYIITFSNFTLKDIVRHYSFASKKIIVTHHGYSKERFNNKIPSSIVRLVQKKYNFYGKYILYLGTLKPSKNIVGLIKAYYNLPEKTINNYKLVIAGKKGWLYQSIYKQVKELKIQNNVVFTDYVSEEDKPGLIFGATLLISPSFWEGFGIHVLEAMACAVPVIVSNVASLPEVAGEAGIYVDPYNIKSISEAISYVLSLSEIEYNKLSRKCLVQAKKFSWDESARITMNVFERCLK